MIPQVKSYRVRFTDANGRTVCSTIVETINKKFAFWMANEELSFPCFNRNYHAVKAYVSLIRKP